MASRRSPARGGGRGSSASSEASSSSDVTVTYEQRSYQWSGPLPPAVELRAYDELVEGGAERIFRQFELEAEHRRSLDNASIEGALRQNRRAQFLAGSFAFGALLVGAYAIYAGAFAVAAVVLGTTLVGVIGAFLYREVRAAPSGK